jgi:membrane dipeptidase
MLIVDAHQDLAWNILTFGRDYTRSVTETRFLEVGRLAVDVNDDTLLGWPEFHRGNVAVIFATLFAAPIRHCMGEWDKVCYTDSQSAYKIYREQLDIYHRLVDEHADKFQLIQDKATLLNLLSDWKSYRDPGEAGQSKEHQNAVGLVILMEGDEGIRETAELESWWNDGLRIIGPAGCGTRFCGGTREPGPLTKQGYSQLERMAEFGYTLDLSHIDEKALLQALDYYPGQIIASHSNALKLLRGSENNRHLTDRAIQGIIERNGIIGIVPIIPFLKNGWRKGDSRREVTLDHVVAQIDYVCQMAGSAHHVGIGTDFDGGFGLQSAPMEIDTVADLKKLSPQLMDKGYSSQEVNSILGGNWLSMLRRTLPEYI